MVRPAADWGSSSMARSRSSPSGMWGMTMVSMNFLMKVDFPVRTGPHHPDVDLAAGAVLDVLVDVVCFHSLTSLL